MHVELKHSPSVGLQQDGAGRCGAVGAAMCVEGACEGHAALRLADARLWLPDSSYMVTHDGNTPPPYI